MGLYTSFQVSLVGHVFQGAVRVGEVAQGHCAADSRRQCEQHHLGLCCGHGLELARQFLSKFMLS